MHSSFMLAGKRRRQPEQKTSGSFTNGDCSNWEDTTPLAGLWQLGHSATNASISPSSRMRQVGRVITATQIPIAATARCLQAAHSAIIVMIRFEWAAEKAKLEQWVAERFDLAVAVSRGRLQTA